MFRIAFFNRSVTFNRSFKSSLLIATALGLSAQFAHANSAANALVNSDAFSFVIGDTVTFRLLDNDQRSSLNTSTFYLSSLPLRGYIRIRDDHSLSHTNWGNSSTTDSFTYRIADYSGNWTDPVTVKLSTQANDNTPNNHSGNAMVVSVGGSATLNLQLESSRYNLSTLWTTTPSNGYTTIPYQGAVKYQHYASKGRSDLFDYSVADYNGNYTRRTITVSVGDGVPSASDTTPPATTPDNNSGWWQPRASENLKWQLQLQGDIRLISGVEVYAADISASQASINTAKAAGAKLKCYISAGSAENWRSDFSSIPSSIIGNAYPGWPGEWWLNTRDINALAPVMRARMDACKNKGFDAIDADNVNGYVNNTGFNLSRSDSVAYIKWLAAEAHARGMAFSLKNSESLIDDVIDHVDMLQSESCYVYNNCDNARKMSARDKAVFAVEYQGNMTASSFNQNVCPAARSYNFSMIYRDLALTPNGVYQSCN